MKRILIADDEESIRIALVALIKRHGYHVESVSNGKLAFETLLKGNFDVAFVDVRMPEIDGITLTSKVIEAKILTTIIVMSAYGSLDDAKKALNAGAYDYITKPFKPDEVVLALTKANERTVLKKENIRLKANLSDGIKSDEIVFSSKPMIKVMTLVKKIARVDSTVLVTGESGTGKELVARALHNGSVRSDRPMICVNCGAIPANLIESELFGHKKGAFTDASTDKTGLFTQADGGTLLLDEIGELPLSLQVKLLRVLQEGTFRPLGSSRDESVDVRIIAATYRKLEENIKSGTFREDLYYRLNVLPVHVPPLRDRKEDIELLISHFINKNNQVLGTKIEGFSKETTRLMLSYDWPGNVRELQNAVERACVLCESNEISISDIPASIISAGDRIQTTLSTDELSIKKTVKIVEQELIRRALKKTGGNRTAASKILEISHRSLLYKLKEYKIS